MKTALSLEVKMETQIKMTCIICAKRYNSAFKSSRLIFYRSVFLVNCCIRT